MVWSNSQNVTDNIVISSLVILHQLTFLQGTERSTKNLRFKLGIVYNRHYVSCSTVPSNEKRAGDSFTKQCHS